ncbi:MAG: hypothetical protein HC835_16950 [Oscillatoriales cyanobacterium RM2_1_1]|nr:hypothetical protein [Oscillatoriales cyanobacterium RM2_1_1]
MIRGLEQAAQSLGINSETTATKKRSPTHPSNSSIENDIPMMYRAQVEGRCSLMFAGNNKDLEKWKDEWIYPNPKQPRYQRKEPPLGLDGNIYRIQVKFPFRLISNGGQDSIIRPILGKDGIPYFSGSSVKGLFRRACNESQAKNYCGDDTNLAPSSQGFRFHGAYPVGDWSNMREVTFKKGDKTEIRYGMLDVVHPQQERQIGSNKQNATALASISLYQPTMIFEFSSFAENTNWKEVENIFWQAIALGFGGKTSTGYGLGAHNSHRPAVIPKTKVDIAFSGRGVSPTLRSDEPEFRPNLFKASLRGHFQRLLSGVMGDRGNLETEVARLFGGSSGPGVLQLLWQQRELTYGTFGKTQTFKVDGILHLNTLRDEDVQLIEQILKFAFIMGGFGKSWRRASHELFHETYKKFEIGCHWELDRTDRVWMDIQSTDQLKTFLTEIHQNYITRFMRGDVKPLDWRESWHPDRLSVYAVETRASKVIDLFHDDTYKTTPAIGGKDPNDKRPKFVSSVWHRMLPIGDGSFLEIITLFHGQRKAWKRGVEEDQLQNFIDSLKGQDLSFIWGNQNPCSEKTKTSKQKKVIDTKPKS